MVHPTQNAIRLALCLLAGGAAACARTPETASIGVAYGNLPTGAQLAQAALDADTGVPRPRIRIVTGPGDTVLPPLTGLAGDVRFANGFARVPDLVGVVGHGSSRASLIAAPVYNDAGIPQIVPNGTSRLLASAGEWTFQFPPDDSVEGEFIGRFAAERLRARRAVVFYVTDEYGSGLRAGSSAALRSRGVEVLDSVPVRDGPVCEVGEAMPAPLIDAALRRNRPDVAILAARNNATECVLRRARQLGLRGLRFVAGDGAEPSDNWASELGSLGDSLFVAVFWHPDLPDASSRDFAARYRAAFGIEPAPGSAMLYDAIMVLVAAVREVGTDRERIRAYLRDLGVGRPPYPGVTGPVSFGPGRRTALYMVQLRRDRWVPVEGS